MESYNNSAMDSLMDMGGDSSDPSSSQGSASPSGPSAPPPPPAGLQISKVPGGFQVSTIVPTIDEAHAISQRFLGPDQSGDESQSPVVPDEEGQEDQSEDMEMAPNDQEDQGAEDESESEGAGGPPAPPTKPAPPMKSRKGPARQ